MDLKTSIGNIRLSTPILNASGVHCTTVEQLKELDECSSFGGVVSKSCTLQPRPGNQPPKYHSTGTVSINSNGLQNHGNNYYVEAATHLNKPYFVSIAGSDETDRLAMIYHTVDKGLPIELNLSCPNVGGIPLLYDFEKLDIFLKIVFEKINPPFLGLKMAPYFVPGDHEKMAEIIKKYPIKFITCINSIPNGFMFKDNHPAIFPNNGYGGLGGGVMMKAIAISQVRKYRSLLPKSVDIIGCGGISSGQDIYEYLIAGASAVQIGTYLYDNCPDSIKSILEELEDIMKKNDFNSIKDIKDKHLFMKQE